MQGNRKKTVLFFENFSAFEEKMDGLKHFEFLEQFMIEKFFVKVTLFEKTGSISRSFISLADVKINFHFRN